MTYHFTANGGIVRDADGVFIPNDPANRDYAEYSAWVADGNTATPYSPPPATWSDCQNQAKVALDQTDTTMHRIAEAVALGTSSWSNADVVAFVQYRRQLRAIVQASSGTPGPLPTRPAYPAGT